MVFQRPKHLAYFISGHGFGHGVRSSAIINALPTETKVTVFTSLPEGFFREEIRRPAETFRLIPCEIDCGCIQPDTLHVDVRATLAAYSGIQARRESHIAQFSQLLKEMGADGVVGDIAPLAFPIARAAGLPSTAICNFAWTDIYQPYQESYPGFSEILRAMTEDYAQADFQLRLEPFHGVPFSRWDVASESVGMLARKGNPRRVALAERFGLDSAKKWALVYIGNYGLGGIAWRRLAEFPEWQFMGLYDLDGAQNYRRLEKSPDFSYADLTASADAILGKLGYGLVSEALAHGKPVLFPGRSDFAEFDTLRKALEARDLGRELALDDLRNMRLGEHLDWAAQVRGEGEDAPAIPKILKFWGF
jgi:hypothetical protein